MAARQRDSPGIAHKSRVYPTASTFSQRCLKLVEMLEVKRPGRRAHRDTVQAVRAEAQYESPREVADQHIWVDGEGGKGRLPCYASRPLDEPNPDVERLIVVVHGALRDSDRYFAGARRPRRGEGLLDRL